MNKLCCFLTGGHRYKDSGRRCLEIPKERRVIVIQSCCKCGKEMFISVPIDCLFTSEEKKILGYSNKEENDGKN